MKGFLYSFFQRTAHRKNVHEMSAELVVYIYKYATLQTGGECDPEVSTVVEEVFIDSKAF